MHARADMDTPTPRSASMIWLQIKSDDFAIFSLFSFILPHARFLDHQLAHHDDDRFRPRYTDKWPRANHTPGICAYLRSRNYVSVWEGANAIAIQRPNLSFTSIMGSVPSKSSSSSSPRESVNEKRTSTVMNMATCSPLSPTGALSLDNISSWEQEVSSDPRSQLARAVFATSDIRSSLISRSAKIADQHVFNTQIEFKTGPRTNQKSSGRCWLFATTNVLRYEIMKKLNLTEFELSQVIRNRMFANTVLILH
jgi:hypothetical protein